MKFTSLIVASALALAPAAAFAQEDEDQVAGIPGGIASAAFAGIPVGQTVVIAGTTFLVVAVGVGVAIASGDDGNNTTGTTSTTSTTSTTATSTN